MKTSVCVCACMYISRPMTEFWPQNEEECVCVCMHVHQQTYDRVLTTKWRRVCVCVHACTSADLWQSFDHKMKTSVCVCACMYISRPMAEFWPQNEDECVCVCRHVHQQHCAGPSTQPTSLSCVSFIKGLTNFSCEQQKIGYLFFAESISNVDLLRCFRCLIMLGMSVWDNRKKSNAQHVCWQSSAFASWNTHNSITGSYL